MSAAAKARSMSVDPSAVHRKQLTVNILEAKAVAAKKEAEKISAYCVVSCNNVCFRTNPQAGTKPEWKQKFTFNEKDIQDTGATLSIVCWSHQKYSKDAFLGQVVIPLTSLNGNTAIKQWWPFAARDDADKNVTGKINLELQLITDSTVIKKKNSAIGKKMKRKLSWDEKKDNEADGDTTADAGADKPADSSNSSDSSKSSKSGSGKKSKSSSSSTSDNSGSNSEDSDSDAEAKKTGDTSAPDAAASAAKAVEDSPRDDDTDAESMVPRIPARNSLDLAGRGDKGTDTDGNDTDTGFDVEKLRANAPRSPRKFNLKDEDEDIEFPPKGGKKRSHTLAGGEYAATEVAEGRIGEPIVVPLKTSGDVPSSSDPQMVNIRPGKGRTRTSIDSNNPATDSDAHLSDPGRRPKKDKKKGKRTKIFSAGDDMSLEERSGSGKEASSEPVAPAPATTPAPASTSATVSTPAKANTPPLVFPTDPVPATTPSGKPSPVRKKSSVFAFVARLGSALKVKGHHSTPASPAGTPSKGEATPKTPASPAVAGSSATASSSTSSTAAPVSFDEMMKPKSVDPDEELLGSDEESSRGFSRGKPSFKKRQKKKPASGEAVMVKVTLPSASSSMRKSPSATAVHEPSSPRATKPVVTELPAVPPSPSNPKLAGSIKPAVKEEESTESSTESSSSSSSDEKKKKKKPTAAPVKSPSPVPSPRPPSPALATPASDDAALAELRLEVSTLKKDYQTKVDDLTAQRESLKEEVAQLKLQVAEKDKQLDSKTKVIEEKDRLIESLRKETSIIRKKDPMPQASPQDHGIFQAQLQREIEQRELAEKKALEYMNQFLQMTQAFKQRSKEDSDLVSKVVALETELSRLRRELAAATATPAAAPAVAASTDAQAAPASAPSAAAAAAAASMQFDFARERKAFEELFERGRRELLEVIERGKTSLNSPTGEDSEVPTDNERIDIPLKKKKRTGKNSARGRGGASSDNDSSSQLLNPPSVRPMTVSVNETAMKIELDQLRKELASTKQANTELSSRLTTLQRRNSVTLPAPTVGGAKPPGAGSPSVPTVPAATANTSTSTVTPLPTTPVATAAADSKNPDAPASARGLPSPASPGADPNSPGGSADPQMVSFNKKSKKLKSVRFTGDLSSDEQAGKGPSWRDNVRKTFGLPKKKPSAGATGPSPWRKPPELGGMPISVKKPNKVDWTRNEQSYWSDDVDSDTYGPGGATSGNESLPQDFPSRSHHADDSDFSENDYTGSDGGSASGSSLPNQAVLNSIRENQ